MCQRYLEVPATPCDMGREQPLLASRVSHERGFVYRCEGADPIRALGDVAPDGIAVIGKSSWEILAPEVEPLRVAVVKEIPDNFHPVTTRRLYEGLDCRKVIASAAEIHQGPADGFPRGMNLEFGELP